jgi:hypothetical protein
VNRAVRGGGVALERPIMLRNQSPVLLPCFHTL